MKDFLKNIIKKWINPLSKMILAMMMIFVVIAILLIQGVVSSDIDNDEEMLGLDTEEVFLESVDSRLNDFIYGYFKARTYLDFFNIYRAFDKDYIRMQDTEEGRRYENGILYEKNFVRDYNNIKIYEHRGIGDDEKVVLMTYDMAFYFSEEQIPGIIVGYVKDDGSKIYFKENLDIGESKYISELMESTMVKTMYTDIKNRLELLLTNDNKLKLAYNSLRQYDINPNNNMLEDKNELMGKIFGTDTAKEKELIDLVRSKEGTNEEK